MESEERDKLLKKIKKLEKELSVASAMITELQDENSMLWDYMEELKRSDMQALQEIQSKFMEELFKSVKTVGDA
jgi:septal ring factor EnvC (AmiA/AmiB activator)